MWDADATRSERQGSESRLRIHALSSRAEFALMAVAPLLPVYELCFATKPLRIGSFHDQFRDGPLQESLGSVLLRVARDGWPIGIHQLLRGVHRR